MRIFAAIALLCLSVSAFAETTSWVPLEIEKGKIVIPITLNGKPARASLNTHSHRNLISQAFLDTHEGEFAKGQNAVVDIMRLEVLGTELEIEELLTTDYKDIDLDIGLPFFEQYVVQIDYPGQRMRFMDHESIDMKKLANVKMRRASGSRLPQVRVKLNGKVKAWLMFSTGGNGPIKYERANAERRGWLEDYAVTQAEYDGVDDSAANVDLLRLPTMTIGPFELENVLVRVSADDDSNGQSRLRDSHETGFRLQKGGKKKADGSLGFDVLQDFIVTIDLKRNRLSLDIPQPEPDGP